MGSRNEALLLDTTTKEDPVRYDHLFIFSVLGLGQLLPWNCFISIYPYWMVKLADNQTDYELHGKSPNYTTSAYQQFWTSSLAVCTMSIMLFTMTVNAVYSSRIARNWRIYPSLLIMILAFGTTTALSQVNTETWTKEFFAITLVIVIFLNAAAAVFQAAIFGVAGTFQGVYFNAMLQGQAVAGVFAAVLAIIPMLLFSKEIDDDNGNPVNVVDQQTSALMFFLVATITVIICVFCYRYLMSLPSTKARLRSTSDCGISGPAETATLKKVFADIQFVGRQTFYQVSSVSLVYWITLAFFPAVTQLSISECSADYSASGYCKFTKDYFIPVFCFVLFNVGDWLGRWLAAFWKLIPKENGPMLLLASFSRIIFGIGFMYTRRTNYTVLGFLGTDLGYALLMTAFSVSNGYIAAMAMEYGPQMVTRAKKELASSIMPIFMALGLLLGAITSFLTVVILPENV